MKKKVIFVLVCIVAIISSFTYSRPEGKTIPTDGEQIRILNYNGHRYICYRWYESHYNFTHDTQSSYSGASIIHDPDCYCNR